MRIGVILCVFWFCFAGGLKAETFVANQSGNWSDPAIWTPNGVPGVGDDAVVAEGATGPLTVTLDANVSIERLDVGGNDTSAAIVDLQNSFTLTANRIIVGQGGKGKIDGRGASGWIETPWLRVRRGCEFVFGPQDQATQLVEAVGEGASVVFNANTITNRLDVYLGASATTASDNNFASNAKLNNSGTVTLGGDLNGLNSMQLLEIQTLRQY